MSSVLFLVVYAFWGMSPMGATDPGGGHSSSTGNSSMLCYGWCYSKCEMEKPHDECSQFCNDLVQSLETCKDDTCWQECGGLIGSDMPDNLALYPVWFLLLNQDSNPYVVNVSWNSAANATYYAVQWRDRVRGGPWKNMDEVFDLTWFEFTKLSVCGLYQFRVSAINQHGFSAWSELEENILPPVKWSSDLPALTKQSMSMAGKDQVRVVMNFELPIGWKAEDVEVDIQLMPVTECSKQLSYDNLEINGTERTAKFLVPYDPKCEMVIIYAGAKTVCSDQLSPNNYIYRLTLENCSEIQGSVCDAPEDPCNYVTWCNLKKINGTALRPWDTCSNTTDMRIQYSEVLEMSETVGVDKCVTQSYILLYGSPASVEYATGAFSKINPLARIDKEIGRVVLPVDGNNTYVIRDVDRAMDDLAVQICALFKKNVDSEVLQKAFNLSSTTMIPIPHLSCPDAVQQTSSKTLAMSIGIPLGIALGITLAVLFLIHKKTKRDVKKIRTMASLLIDQRYVDCGSPDIQDKWELDRRKLIVYEEETLGKGAFGKVFKGKILGRAITAHAAKSPFENTQEQADDMVVAVKQCYEYADDTTKQDFKQEISLMKKLYYHNRLVNILHCITANEPLSLIVEYCANGDLLHYLRERRKYMQLKMEEGVDLANPGPNSDLDQTMIIRLRDVIQMGFQVADGMEYLSQKGFCHRDLAARNILVDDEGRLKIGDFGLTRFIHTDSVYMARGGKLPIKWMALEAIERYEFTIKSDIWSFGVLLFEIITLGGAPYADIMPLDGDFRKAMLEHLLRGHRMEQPDNCPDELYEIMQETWKLDPASRPTFTDVKEDLRQMVEVLAAESDGSEYYDGFYINPEQSYYMGPHPDDELSTPQILDPQNEAHLAVPEITAGEAVSPGSPKNLQTYGRAGFEKDAGLPRLDSVVSESETSGCYDEHTHLTAAIKNLKLDRSSVKGANHSDKTSQLNRKLNNDDLENDVIVDDAKQIGGSGAELERISIHSQDSGIDAPGSAALGISSDHTIRTDSGGAGDDSNAGIDSDHFYADGTGQQGIELPTRGGLFVGSDRQSNFLRKIPLRGKNSLPQTSTDSGYSCGGGGSITGGYSTGSSDGTKLGSDSSFSDLQKQRRDSHGSTVPLISPLSADSLVRSSGTNFQFPFSSAPKHLPELKEVDFSPTSSEDIDNFRNLSSGSDDVTTGAPFESAFATEVL